MTPEKIKAACAAVGLEERFSQVIQASRPSIVLHAHRISKEAELGSSRLGGLPDLGLGQEWPLWKERPLSFIAQINLRDLSHFPASRELPSDGLLSFFYDSEQSTWGFDPNDTGSFSVVFQPEQNLRNAARPKLLPVEAVFPACRLTFTEVLSPPAPDSYVFNAMGFSDLDRHKYFDALHHLDGDDPFRWRSHLLGHPDQIQGDMQEECALVAAGLYCGDEKAYSDPRRPILAREAPSWKLLLQIASEKEAGMMWGDLGCLYYWIHERDLRKQLFDRSWMILQCG